MTNKNKDKDNKELAEVLGLFTDKSHALEYFLKTVQQTLKYYVEETAATATTPPVLRLLDNTELVNDKKYLNQHIYDYITYEDDKVDTAFDSNKIKYLEEYFNIISSNSATAFNFKEQFKIDNILKLLSSIIKVMIIKNKLELDKENKDTDQFITDKSCWDSICTASYKYIDDFKYNNNLYNQLYEIFIFIIIEYIKNSEKFESIIKNNNHTFNLFFKYISSNNFLEWFKIPKNIEKPTLHELYRHIESSMSLLLGSGSNINIFRNIFAKVHITSLPIYKIHELGIVEKDKKFTYSMDTLRTKLISRLHSMKIEGSVDAYFRYIDRFPTHKAKFMSIDTQHIYKPSTLKTPVEIEAYIDVDNNVKYKKIGMTEWEKKSKMEFTKKDDTMSSAEFMKTCNKLFTDIPDKQEYNEACVDLLTQCLSGDGNVMERCNAHFNDTNFYENAKYEVANIDILRIYELLKVYEFRIIDADDYIDRDNKLKRKQYEDFDSWLNNKVEDDKLKAEDADIIKKNDKLRTYLNAVVGKINTTFLPTTISLSEQEANKLLQQYDDSTNTSRIPTKYSSLRFNPPQRVSIRLSGGNTNNELPNSLLDLENILDNNIYQYNILNKYINQLGGDNIDTIINNIKYLDNESGVYNRLKHNSKIRMSAHIYKIFSNILQILKNKNMNIDKDDKEYIIKKIEELENQETELIDMTRQIGKYILLILSDKEKSSNKIKLFNEKFNNILEQSKEKISTIMKKQTKLVEGLKQYATIRIQQLPLTGVIVPS